MMEFQLDVTAWEMALSKLRNGSTFSAVQFLTLLEQETEADFEDSLRIVSEAGFAQIHAFPYSPREGTNAFKKYKELPFALKKERVEKLLKAGAREREKYMQSFVGKTLEIVPERYENGFTEGYSENYIRVYVSGETGKYPIQVCVERLFKDGVLAKKIK